MKFEKLGDIATNLDSRRIPLNSIERDKKAIKGLYPYIGANNIVGYIDEYIFDEKILCIAEDGGSWGKEQVCANIYYGKTWVNNHAHVLIENGRANLEYLKFFLNYADLTKYITGTTRGKLTRSALNDIIVPLPDLDIQIKIANLLSIAEGLMGQRKVTIALWDEFLESTFYKMFGDLDRNRTKEFVIDELKSGGNETFSNGPFGSDLLTSELKNKGVPVIYIRDIRNGSYVWKSEVYVTADKANSLPNCKVFSEDVLIAKVGDPPGVSAVYPKNSEFAIITQDVIRIRLNQKIVLPKFFSFYINSEFGKRSIKKISVEGTRNRFPLGDLKKLKVYIPGLQVQKEFVRIVERVENLKAYYGQSLNELENLFNSLNQKAFKGELSLTNISPRIIEASIDENVSAADELEVTVIKTEPPPLKKSNKPSTFETISTVAGKMGNYRPLLENVLPFIQKTFGEEYFTFEKLKEAIIVAGWQYDFETLKGFLFQLLRQGELRQVFIDSAFKASVDVNGLVYKRVEDLNEQIYLQRTAVL